MLKLFYPGGKTKAFNVTYDDGVLQDVRFVSLLDQYGLKGTFNLNSGLMQQGFSWRHPCGLLITRLSPQEACQTYIGHEVASHSFSHPYMDHFTPEQILQELSTDRAYLQQLFHQPIFGYATPFYFFSQTVAHCAQACGFQYARISETDPSYTPWRDPFAWKAGIFHEDPSLENYVDGFLMTTEPLALCQIVGHSYDLDVSDSWGRMEIIFSRIAQAEEVWPATHRDILTYLQAARQLKFDGKSLTNPSPLPIFVGLGNQLIQIPAGHTISL